MIETIKTCIIILLLVYCFIITFILLENYRKRDQYLKDKVEFINKKTDELNSRERVLVGREVCDRELTRLKTIHKSALDVLNSYNQMQLP